ncbi:hypothetical protein J4Q44_G00222250 [Coregonus suidteri]|uniref:Uncharacterized protein n=1 Tax=Coregonus suidteri TaxID=861788 RepID=A0AAN8LEQ5_9TELE
MTKMVIAYIGFLLLAMHLSSQVYSQNIGRRPTTRSPAVTVNTTKVGGARSNMTKLPDVTTTNITIPKGACVSLESSAFTLFIPMVAGSLVQGRL